MVTRDLRCPLVRPVLGRPSALLVALLLLGASASAQTPFSSSIDVGIVFNDFLLVDADGDDDDDVLLLGRDVVVMLGDGDGGFGPPVSYAAGDFSAIEFPSSMCVADLNEDGVPDVVTVGFYGGVNLLLGVGDGSFQAPRTQPLYGNYLYVAAGDLDGDTHVDLIVGIQKPYPVIAVFPGHGDGTLGPVRAWGTTRTLGDLEVGDLNTDGKLDLVTIHRDDDLALVHLGRGDGSFQAPLAYPTVDVPLAVAVADADADGAPDVLVTSIEQQVLGLHPGLGDGRLGPFVSLPGGARARRPSVADMDGDGFPDVVTSGGDVKVLRGLGSGRFASPLSWMAGAWAEWVAVSDLDHDGLLDLVTADQQGESVTPLLAKEVLRYESPVFYPVPEYLFPGAQSLSAGDLDRDGFPDLVSAVGRDGDLHVLWSRGGGEYDAPVLVDAGESAEAAVVADVTQDGRLDVVFSDRRSGSIGVLPGRGDGTFGDRIASPVSPGATHLVVARFDRDRLPDVAVTRFGPDAVSVLLGTGGGRFEETGGADLGASPQALAAGDLDGDGSDDLVVVTVLDYRDYSLQLLFGNGDGTLEDADEIPLGSQAGASFVSLADLDGDGNLDIVTGSRAPGSGGKLDLFFGRGDRSFEAPLGLRLGARLGGSLFPTGAVVGDFDGDGLADLVATARYTFSVLFRGAGARSFQPPEVFFTRHSTGTHMVTGDLDRDGLLDLALATRAGMVVALNLLEPPLPVEIDIEPARDDNLVDPWSPGLVAVAVLGSDGFHVSDIDVSSLAFGPGAATPVRSRRGNLRDTNADGRLDLVSHYRVRDTGILSGDSDACVSGALGDGTAFHGCDSLRTGWACGLGFEVALLLLPPAWLRRRRIRSARPDRTPG